MKFFKEFNITESNPTLTLEVKLEFDENDEGDLIDFSYYRSLMESLRYLTRTRLDLLFCVGFLSQFMEKPTSEHWKCAKRVLRYVIGKTNFSLICKRGRCFSWKDIATTAMLDILLKGNANPV